MKRQKQVGTSKVKSVSVHQTNKVGTSKIKVQKNIMNKSYKVNPTNSSTAKKLQ